MLAAAFVLTASSALANEILYFQNGFTLEATSHLQRGDVVEVHVGSGSLEFPAQEIIKVDALPVTSLPVSTLTKGRKETSVETLLSDAAVAQGMDAAFVRSVGRVESGLKQDRISRKGAVGLMQLMPGTAKELGVDASRSEENARGGVQYLRTLLLRYRGDSALALAAYNAGPGAVEKFRGVPPYLETRHYVLAVLKEYNRQLRLQQTPSKQAPAATRGANRPSAID